MMYRKRLTTVIAIPVAALISLFVHSARPVTSPGAPPEVLNGHENIIGGVVFSPDGKWIASASMDRTVRLWEAATGKPGNILRGHSDEVYAVAFSPDGRQLASTGYDGKTMLWDVATAKMQHTLQGYGDWSVALAYSPDGKQLAVGSMDGSVWFFDPSSGAKIRSISAEQSVSALAFSPDGHYLATAFAPINFTDLKTGAKTRTLPGPTNLVSGMAFSHDGRQLAAGSFDKNTYVWEVASGQLVATLKPTVEVPATASAQERAIAQDKGTLPVTGVAFSPDGKLLATSGADKMIRVWDIASSKELRKFEGHTRAATGVTFSPDGKTIASSGADKSIRIWKVAP